MFLFSYFLLRFISFSLGVVKTKLRGLCSDLNCKPGLHHVTCVVRRRWRKARKARRERNKINNGSGPFRAFLDLHINPLRRHALAKRITRHTRVRSAVANKKVGSLLLLLFYIVSCPAATVIQSFASRASQASQASISTPPFTVGAPHPSYHSLIQILVCFCRDPKPPIHHT